MSITRVSVTDDDGTGTTGTVLNAALLTSVYDSIDEEIDDVRTGDIELASQAANDFIYAASASQLARLAAVDGKVPKYTTAGGWAMASGSPLELLKGASGSDTSAGATNLSFYDMASGLSALDRLVVMGSVSAVSQPVAGLSLYSSTDSLSLVDLTIGNAIVAGTTLLFRAELSRSHLGTTTLDQLTISRTSAANNRDSAAQVSLTTSYQGNWRLNLRHAGVTAGGTMHYNWGLFVVRGQ